MATLEIALVPHTWLALSTSTDGYLTRANTEFIFSDIGKAKCKNIPAANGPKLVSVVAVQMFHFLRTPTRTNRNLCGFSMSRFSDGVMPLGVGFLAKKFQNIFLWLVAGVLEVL